MLKVDIYESKEYYFKKNRHITDIFKNKII